MPNHFHFILRPKVIIDLNSQISSNKKGLHGEECIYSKSLAKLISSYTQAFNKVYHRSGSLFESPFKRIRIDSEEYLRNLIIYIHQNHDDFQNYKYSSYKAIVSNSETSISKKEVLYLFDDVENFVRCHQNNIDETLIEI